MAPRLSVIVPFYGVEDYIEDCLDSIRVQSLTDIEVILVDDGSLDGSATIAQEFVDRDGRFQIVRQDNQGLGPARNTGTGHATGEFLTFIDSDDLVTVHGFERMVRSLDESGSSLVGGNARRFNNSAGVRPSWSHRNAFATRRVATHISEFPPIARDRMVWNKVYRRSFWDEFGYEFPAIRYEDYPVTLKAHIDALTVDVMSNPVYYWRERESGDSITQQAFRYDNLLDRVISAEMVLDVLDGQSAAVRTQVLDALAETDLVTINQAFATVPDDEADSLLRLGERLAGQLGPDTIARRHVYDRIQHHALRAHDVALLRDLAVYRGDGGLRGWARGSQHPVVPWRLEFPYPGLGSRSVPRRLYTVPRRQVGLRTSVSSALWSEEGLRLRGTAEVRHVPTTAEDSRLTMRFGVSNTWRDLPVLRSSAVDSHGDESFVGFDLLVDRATLAALAGDKQRPGRVEVNLKSGSRFSSDQLKFALPGSATWPEGGWVTDGIWAQPTSTKRSEFIVTWLSDAARVTAATVSGGSFRITVTVPRPVESADLVIDGNLMAPQLTWPAAAIVSGASTTIEFAVPIEAIIDGVEHDDPFLQSNVRGVRLACDDEPAALVLWEAGDRSVGTVHGAHLLRLTRSPAARVNLIEAPVRLTAAEARVEGTGTDQVLVVSGQNWSGRDDWSLSWRRYLPNSDDHVDASSVLVLSPGGWSVTTTVTALLAVPSSDHDVGLDRVATRAAWSLFATSGDGTSSSVIVEPFLNTDLPLEVTRDRRRATVRPQRDILHVEIRDNA